MDEEEEEEEEEEEVVVVVAAPVRTEPLVPEAAFARTLFFKYYDMII